MIKIDGEYYYLYGAFYDVKIGFESSSNYDVVVFGTTDSCRTFDSLEGIFIAKKAMEFSQLKINICRRDQMKEFAEKYKGKFIPFEKED